MKSIYIKKAELIEIIEENLAQHVIDFKLAHEGYIEAVEEKCQDMLVQIQRAGPSTDLNDLVTRVNLTAPVNYESEYRLILRKLELEVSDTIELDDNEFNRYVDNKWDWSHMNNQLNTMYASKTWN